MSISLKKQGILNTGLVNIAGLLAVYGISLLLFRNLAVSTRTWQGTFLILAAGTGISFLWLSFYYFLDRKEPEPLHMVLYAFLTGIIAELFFNAFIGNVVFGMDSWESGMRSVPLLKLLFKAGVLPALAVFTAMRFVFYPSSDFNEPVDGMIYGAFTGIGYGFMFVMSDVFSLHECSVHYLVFTLTIKIALMGALSALVGFYFGYAKLRKSRRLLYTRMALLIAAAVFLVYALLDKRLKTGIVTSNDLFGLLLTLLFMVLSLGFAYFLIQRTIDKHEPGPHEEVPFFSDTVTVAVLLALLVCGTAVRIFHESDYRFLSPDKKTSFMLPSSYRFKSERNGLYVFTRRDPADNTLHFLNVAVLEGPVQPLPGAAAPPGRKKPVEPKRYTRKLSSGDGVNRGVLFVSEYSVTGDSGKIVVGFEDASDFSAGRERIVRKIARTLVQEGTDAQ